MILNYYFLSWTPARASGTVRTVPMVRIAEEPLHVGDESGGK
ncbi:hypothetical protein D3OALGB2SA_2776 [Olavius algarvensis associated proteobacterium Delta 3]|nr:hypothetical protein D3OALGB2SA_2776 [Olavius algarvensis associated proteobacterium Delta 3]